MGTNEPKPLLHSVHNRQKSLVRFINTSSHRVEILWLNYSGQAISYGILCGGHSLDISTYVTHPWIVVEAETRDRFMMNGKDVFYPEVWFAKYRGVPRAQLPPQIEADLIYITLPMYNLLDIALKTIKSLLHDDNDAFHLEIPKELQRRLATMRPRKGNSCRQGSLEES